ncbi:EAL domain-containing protein [Neptuniibacter sp. CAU 1671]|uniref:putative bifunctional diguanylate cyclase/phosphodiesterase n=1 Tax=Neptuniibacter sp. CAU 1671 TaxID=3032593 RepID=UPI0023DB9ECB|nr:EAL domain-containing protein [Neptuniibacter sp. CAU 1671]MDF2181094.1 EAL domain-containing protein [Neptuniibacter sp. CAU 1671]
MDNKNKALHQPRAVFFTAELNVAAKVAFFYFVFAVSWIVASDSALEYIVRDVSLLSYIQTIKGLLFVLISAVLIFALVNRYAKILREKESHLRTLVDTLPDLVWLKDKEGVYLSCNRKFERFFGAQEHQIVGRTDYDFVDSELSDFFRANDLAAMAAGGPCANEEELTYVDDGHTELVETIKTPMVDSKGKLIGVLGVGRDITLRRQNEQEVRLLKEALEQSPVAVILMDSNCRVTYVNSAYTRQSGYDPELILGDTPAFMFDDNGDIAEPIQDAVSAGQSWSGEISSQSREGAVVWEYLIVSPVQDDDGTLTHYLAVMEDITLRKRQEDRLWFQAHYDELTGLPNRMLVLDRLQQMIKEGERTQEQIAVLFLDMDDFKKINDSMGHDVGDKALREAASRLRAAVRAGDTVGRLGGDEFIVLANRMNSADGVPVIASHILQGFQEPFNLDGRAISLTASVGVALYPDDGQTPSELLKNADSAMYVAKEKGRDRFAFFESRMNLEVARRLQIEELLGGAIERGEIYVVFQPQINLKTTQVQGVEALLRWDSPLLGPVRPDEFISVAEQTGQIVALGRFVIKESLSSLQDWLTAAADFRLAINLSPRQFRDEHLVEFIQDALQLCHIDPRRLELEITEGVLMTADKLTLSVLNTLHQKGISLALDDFGVGYSSLSYLRNYPFDLLKIDRSFIQDMTEDSGDCALVNATVVMARALGIKVLAEGVETELQEQLLQRLGCDLVQGFFYSRPVPASELKTYLNAPPCRNEFSGRLNS